MLYFSDAIRVFVLYSHYGYSILNEKLNGQQTFESEPLRSTHFSLQTTHFIIVIIINK